MLIVPGSWKLSFDLAKAGYANNYFVQNVTRNLQARMDDKVGGEILSDVSHYCIYETFRDLWLTEKQRKNLVLQGIGTANLRRLRAGAGNDDKSEETHNAVFKACRLTFYYDYVTYFKSQTTGTDKTMNINVNIPRRSMKGVLVFFQEAAVMLWNTIRNAHPFRIPMSLTFR
jgi:hypothetical protein